MKNTRKGSLNSFQPQHEDGITRQQILRNMFAHALKDTHQNFNNFGRAVVV